jgi:hypothetical protein
MYMFTQNKHINTWCDKHGRRKDQPHGTHSRAAAVAADATSESMNDGGATIAAADDEHCCDVSMGPQRRKRLLEAAGRHFATWEHVSEGRGMPFPSTKAAVSR